MDNKNSSNKAAYICSVCQFVLSEPMTGPLTCSCSSITICRDHLQQLDTFKCETCKKVSTILRDAFKENVTLKNEMILQLGEVNTQRIELELYLKKIAAFMNSANERMSPFALAKENHFFNIKNDIDIRRETLLQEAIKRGTDTEEVFGHVNRSSEFLINQADTSSETFTANLNRKIKEFRDLFNKEKEETNLKQIFTEPNVKTLSSALSSLLFDFETRFREIETRLDQLCDFFESNLKKNKFIYDPNSIPRSLFGKLFFNNLLEDGVLYYYDEMYPILKGNCYYEKEDLKYEEE